MNQITGINSIIAKSQNIYPTGKKSGVNTNAAIGQPELSEKASAYYEKLKQKYGNAEFVLVDDEQVDSAKEQASNYGAYGRMVVLISESEVEEMAVNEDTRNKNEQFIENSMNQMPELLERLKKSGVNVKSFGIEISDDGTSSYFAVVDKSMAAQKERIQQKAAEKRETAKEEQKEALEKIMIREEDISGNNSVLSKKGIGHKEDLTTVTASSMEDLVKKIQKTLQMAQSDAVKTRQEMMVGQHIDFSL